MHKQNLFIDSSYSAGTNTLVSDPKMLVNQSDQLHVTRNAGKQMWVILYFSTVNYLS